MARNIWSPEWLTPKGASLTTAYSLQPARKMGIFFNVKNAVLGEKLLAEMNETALVEKSWWLEDELASGSKTHENGVGSVQERKDYPQDDDDNV